MSQDRDLVEEERQARLAARADDRTRPSSAASGGRSGMDSGTKKLAIVAGGLGGLLVLMVGGWSLLGHHPSGIPILSPPPGPVRVKPLDPGGMQLMGTQVAQTNGTAVETLQPGPEQAAPQALQAEVDKAREADHPTPAPTALPAPSVASNATPTPSTPPIVAPDATIPTPSPKPAPVAPTSAPAFAPASAPTTAVAPPPPPIGHHAVQLAALDSDQAAHAEWSRLSRKAPTLFADRTPVITSVSRDGKLFFRLRTGGFDTIADATAFCSRAKAAGLACTLADF